MSIWKRIAAFATIIGFLPMLVFTWPFMLLFLLLDGLNIVMEKLYELG